MSEPQSLEFLRSDAVDPPVTVIRDIRVHPGAEGRFELLIGALVQEANRQQGHLGATIVRPHVAGEPYRFIYKFDRKSNLQAWHESDLRARLFEPIREVVVSDRFGEYPGLETWFDLPPHLTPPKWKTTLMSWAAIYVVVLIVSYGMVVAGLEAPLPIRALILTALVVPTVAYFVAPWLGRLLHPWLHAGLGHNQ